jgi:hypothetical protein
MLDSIADHPRHIDGFEGYDPLMDVPVDRLEARYDGTRMLLKVGDYEGFGTLYPGFYFDGSFQLVEETRGKSGSFVILTPLSVFPVYGLTGLREILLDLTLVAADGLDLNSGSSGDFSTDGGSISPQSAGYFSRLDALPEIGFNFSPFYSCEMFVL